MIDRFYDRLREAVIERRAADLPRVVSIFSVVIGFTLAYIIFATILVPTDEPLEYHFVHEYGAITSLSAVFLAVASAFCLASMVTLIRARDSHKWEWFVLASGFAFLWADESLEFHERAGDLMDGFTGSGLFRHWNDIIVVLYGVLAVAILIALLPGLMRWRMVLELFAIAFLFYGIHTFVDSTSEPATSFSIILEESAKLFSGAFLMIGTLVGFIGVVWKNTKVDPSKNDA